MLTIENRWGAGNGARSPKKRSGDPAMFAMRIRSTALAVAVAALAVTTVTSTIAAAAPTTAPDAVRGMNVPGLNKPSIDVTFLDKADNVLLSPNHIYYRFRVKNTGLRDTVHISNSGLCMYRHDNGEEFWINWHTTNPSWVNEGLKAGSSLTYIVQCQKVHPDGAKLFGAEGYSQASYFPSKDEASDRATSW
jgi:hypothetical protein